MGAGTQKLGDGVAVDDQAHSPADILIAGEAGELVQQDHTGLRIAIRGPAVNFLGDGLLRQAQDKVHLPPVIERVGGLGIGGEAEGEILRAQAALIVIVGALGQGQGIALPGGNGVGAVGDQGGGGHGPILLGGRGTLHGHGGRRRADTVDEIRTAAAERHHEGLLVRGGHLEGLRIPGPGRGVAGHHVQQLGVFGAGLRGHQALPGVDKVLGGDLGAVGPGGRTELEGVGLLALGGGVALVAAGHTVYSGGAAAAVGLQLHQVFKQMAHYDLFLIRRGQGRVQGGGNAAKAHPEGKAVLPAAACQQARHQGQGQEQGRVSL